MSEKSRFPAQVQIAANEGKKFPGHSTSTHTPTNTFGFKKSSSTVIITASGAVLTSGSATLGRIPKSKGFTSSRLAAQQSAVDDGYLSPNARTSLQYRSLPRPSRSNGSAARGATRPFDAGSVTKATATSSDPKSRSSVRSAANQTDREKGVFSDTDTEILTPGCGKSSHGGTFVSVRPSGGKGSETSSPTAHR